MNYILTIIISGLVAIGSWIGLIQLEEPIEPLIERVEVLEEEQQLFSSWSPVGGLTYRLQSSIGTTNTSIKLSSFKNRTDIALTMALMASDIGYGTLSPQTTRSEFVSFTGVTQNSDGTATLTGVSRGLADISPFTASTTMAEAHPGQSVFILSDSPQLFEEYASRRSNETITGRWNYSTLLPYSSINATTSDQFVRKGLLDATAAQGAATSTETKGGIVEMSTRTEMASTTALTATKPLALHAGLSTSTPDLSTGTSQNNWLVVSENDGKLNQGWLDLTEQFIFSSTTSRSLRSGHATTSTLTATSTIKTLDLAGVAYDMPDTRGASSTVLAEDGSGGLNWVGQDWVFLGETTLTGTNATTTVNISARKHLKIFAYVEGITTANQLQLVFNNSLGVASTTSTMWVNKTGKDTQSGVGMVISPGTTTPQYIEIDVSNEATKQKIVKWSGTILQGSAVAPTSIDGVGVWDNKVSQITIVEIWVKGNTFLAGTRLTVYGSRN